MMVHPKLPNHLRICHANAQSKGLSVTHMNCRDVQESLGGTTFHCTQATSTYRKYTRAPVNHMTNVPYSAVEQLCAC